MPSRNVEKLYESGQYYHVYNRGVNKQDIFLDDEDYAVFLNLLKRYLDKEPYHDKFGRNFPWLHENLELLAFCLMRNHFHLCFYLKEEKAIETLMRGIGTAYTRYFNRKYGRVGTLFQGVYKASWITTDAYLQHVTRYIHLNPKEYKHYRFSSLPYYRGEKQAAWVQPSRILEMFPQGVKEYLEFIADYEGYKKELNNVKYELANGQES